MSFAVVLEGMTIAAFVVLLVGGKQKREQGWGFMATMAALAALVQAIGGSIVVCQSNNPIVSQRIQRKRKEKKQKANMRTGISERQRREIRGPWMVSG